MNTQPPDSVVLQFDNLLSEHLAAERLYYRFTLGWKTDKLVAVVLFLFGAYFSAAAGIRWWTLIWFPLAVVEWFNLLSLRPLQIWFFFNRNPKFLGTYRLSFSDAGIQFKTTSIESTLAWTHYTRVLESDRLVLLVYGTRMYTVIPKRAFSDPSQQADFEALLRRHVPERSTAGA